MNTIEHIIKRTEARPGDLDWPVTAALRALAMDMVEQAKAGHPGAPMGMAEIAAILWRRHLRHNPANPLWPDRDRFVLSNGHASALLYALLHLTGYDLPLAELRRFRQLHSRTPGHPEYGVTPGVETTTGPLGQGFANAVGMAIAERTLAAQFNRPGHDIVDHRSFVFLGDGCMMEGISHEAASLAGRLGLGKLVACYDDNAISIDGKVSGWFTDDTPRRFEAYGWQVLRDIDGHDPTQIEAAVQAALAQTERPSLLCCRTIIGRGAPTKEGHQDTHGAPLGPEEILRAREAMHWPYPAFEIPFDVAAAWDHRAEGAATEAEWQERFARYRAAYPELAAEYSRRIAGRLRPELGPAAEAAYAAITDQKTATRKSGQIALTAFAPAVPELLGGSADLTHSNLTFHPGSIPITDNPAGNQISFGVREFGMAAIANGIALHGGFIPFVATFLVFSDYARNAIRMSALMRLRVIYVMTHDSIALGEDGPTHQPVEQLASLRLIPHLEVWRPCDTAETICAWAEALRRHDGPTLLALSRQALPAQPRSPSERDAIRRGGYVLAQSGPPQAVLLATGSEVALAMAAAQILVNEDIFLRVVSMPCVSRFEAQDEAYRADVLPPDLPVITLEAGATAAWRAYAGRDGATIGLDRFGESGPEAAVLEAFGFTPAGVAARIRMLLGRHLNERS
ncbi:MAG TPA: transketolase [Acidocella sp.]|jgi:transketolase|uniref:transketolase n=1 Tax=Acidocella sp. TaxID=50710 RepID=UPI002C6273B6|nr:transketolase [Acidocella sp.]HVE20546.1 transketolase [Acidocella sp.]